MAHSSTTMDMTKGSIWKSLFLFSLPLLLGNLFQQLYSTVDSLVVGNFVGADALGAVTSMMPAVNTLIGLFMGISTGASVIISQYFGAHDPDMLKKPSIHPCWGPLSFPLFLMQLVMWELPIWFDSCGRHPPLRLLRRCISGSF